MPIELLQAGETAGDGEHVFLFAHQDDEFGVFPLIDFLVRRGMPIRCLYLTDGGARVAAGVRNRESLRVLDALGVTARSVAFLGAELGIADGRLYRHLDLAGEALAMQLSDCRLATLYVPAYEGGHHDHDCVHALGVVLGHARPGAAVRQFPLYHGKGLAGPWFKVLDPIAENGRPLGMSFSLPSAIRYSLSCRRYRSQWRTWIGIWPFFAWKTLFRRLQVLQETTGRVFCERPHAGPTLYERRFGMNYDTVASALAAFAAGRR